MFIFFDETFRQSKSAHKLGALCGVAVPEELISKIISEVYSMKYNSFGERFAKEEELKASKLFRRVNFKKQAAGLGSPYLDFTMDVLRYARRLKLMTFGVVYFDTTLKTFACDDPYSLDITYRTLFERIDRYMTNEYPRKRAKLIFDDVGYGANAKRAAAITNFFNRTNVGRGYDSIVRTPFFAMSQSHNIGLQLADVVTGVIGMRFQGEREIMPFWKVVHEMLYRYQLGAKTYSSLRVIRPRKKTEVRQSEDFQPGQ